MKNVYAAISLPVVANLQRQHKPSTVELRSMRQSGQPACLDQNWRNCTVAAIW